MYGDSTISAKSKMSLAILNNEIVEAEYKSHPIIPIDLEGYDKLEHNNKWRKYCERVVKSGKQRGQELSMIRGQCMQVFLDKAKHDIYWDTISESYDPLTLQKIVKKKY